jgi:hypothetical protein
MTHEPSTLHPALREARLAGHLESLRGSLASLEAPARLEEGLVKAFREHRARAERAVRPRLWWMPPLALAATVAAISWIARGPAPTLEMPPAGPATTESAPFLALRPLDRIALEPAATVVTTEFPRALLAQWGLPVAPELAGEPVRAEMLYSPDGEPLAVRLLN